MPGIVPATTLRTSLALVAALTLGACAHPVTTELEFYPSPRPQAVFSPAVRFGNLLFVSGQIGTDSTGRYFPKHGRIRGQLWACDLVVVDHCGFDRFRAYLIGTWRIRSRG